MDETHKHGTLDFEMLAAAAGGNVAAFEQLYQLYAKRVFQYACTLVYDRTLAEDVVAETMVAVWRGAGSFSHTARVSTWILGIARHKALDALRRSGKRGREVPLDEIMNAQNGDDNPVDKINRKQVTALTQKALSMLSPQHQEVLRLVFEEELPYEEIAALLSIPVNTVKTRVYYAKQQLKRQLEKLGQCGPE